jgi:hypothetical protein
MFWNPKKLFIFVLQTIKDMNNTLVAQIEKEISEFNSEFVTFGNDQIGVWAEYDFCEEDLYRFIHFKLQPENADGSPAQAEEWFMDLNTQEAKYTLAYFLAYKYPDTMTELLATKPLPNIRPTLAKLEEAVNELIAFINGSVPTDKKICLSEPVGGFVTIQDGCAVKENHFPYPLQLVNPNDLMMIALKLEKKQYLIA